jgi:hypothetical protein
VALALLREDRGSSLMPESMDGVCVRMCIGALSKKKKKSVQLKRIGIIVHCRLIHLRSHNKNTLKGIQPKRLNLTLCMGRTRINSPDKREF